MRCGTPALEGEVNEHYAIRQESHSRILDQPSVDRFHRTGNLALEASSGKLNR
jgi:hypothetical protein